MKIVKVIETSDELLSLTYKMRTEDNLSTSLLPTDATLVFENDMSQVFLQKAGEFTLSDDVTVDQVIRSLATAAGLSVHIT